MVLPAAIGVIKIAGGAIRKMKDESMKNCHEQVDGTGEGGSQPPSF